MLIKKNLLLFSFCFHTLFSTICISQTNGFVAGYYINQKGDTVAGFGYLKADEIPVFFRFKRQLSDDVFSNISYDSCKLLYLADEVYVIWNGKRSMTYVDKYDFTIKNIDSTVKSFIPLKLIYKGSPLSLYHFHDVKDHFFLGDGEAIEELAISYRYLTDWEKRLHVRNTPAYFISPFFRNQIISKFESGLSRKQMNILENTDYKKNSLIKLFKALNQ